MTVGSAIQSSSHKSRGWFVTPIQRDGSRLMGSAFLNEGVSWHILQPTLSGDSSHPVGWWWCVDPPVVWIYDIGGKKHDLTIDTCILSFVLFVCTFYFSKVSFSLIWHLHCSMQDLSIGGFGDSCGRNVISRVCGRAFCNIDGITHTSPSGKPIHIQAVCKVIAWNCHDV